MMIDKMNEAAVEGAGEAPLVIPEVSVAEVVRDGMVAMLKGTILVSSLTLRASEKTYRLSDAVRVAAARRLARLTSRPSR